ncbi:MAG: hypothetical protein M9921_02640 [Fimbriimonadaceae bacterium]|nr:ArsR family transcriptional regulator [Chthonomonadaceae bacterium]MCO5295730.1 hypothetical protein [Fimbriimonadaceae bacterium]
MKIDRKLGLFGTRLRTRLLLVLSLLDESYATELARLAGARLYAVQKHLEDFEDDGILVSRVIGRERRVSFNPRFFAKKELAALLERLAEQDEEVLAAVRSVRRRPHRKGKEI